MPLFDMHCPLCGSIEWRSSEKDQNGINKAIACWQCGTVRNRKREPVESIETVLNHQPTPVHHPEEK